MSAYDLDKIADLDASEIRQLADFCEERINIKLGYCTACGGTKWDHSEFDCAACEGSGLRVDQERVEAEIEAFFEEQLREEAS